MAIFNGKSSEEKGQEKLQKFIDKYQLNDLTEQDMIQLKRIVSDTAGNDLMKTGFSLSLGNAADQLKISYLSILVEQNWMIMRRLDEISKKLNK